MVLMPSRALLSNTTPQGASAYIEADFNYPERIVAEAGDVLGFEQPLGILFLGVLGHAESYAELVRIAGTVMAAAPSGSYLVLWDGTADSAEYGTLCTNYAGTGGAPYIPRPRDQIRGVFDGLALVEPGFVSITQWRPCADKAGLTRPISAYGAVVRKP
ncbi:SAM-dependent methyltransferase [Nocardia altamirensis]|uniref:SAM-dependent methyltransferase n=1 Tax=Nocardia altamirensis TaxID=472158 RepID=UPI000B256F4A|nr:SAM-dependent methyltransferase [Nocardia altamirensis]